MNNKTVQSNKALIYCRVSSVKQKTEGHGLDAQEHRCRQYAQQRGYEVDKVYKDSFTGGGDYHKRPELSLMLEYLENKPHINFVVLIDDLSRFARDVAAHFKLKKDLQERGVSLECSNFNFEDSPEGELIETMMAAQHQYHRKNNARQVTQKQKARLEKGYWSFNPPPGYKSVKDPVHGKLLHPTKDAKLIKEAFEGFESGRFLTQTEVKDFLNKNNFRGKDKKTYIETVNRLLTRPIYAAIIEYPEWEVEARDGHHEPIISKETFYNVQRILTQGRRVRTRKDMSKVFPLRGLVKSAGGTKPYTASYSTGRKNKYAYYRDTDKKSPFYNKSFKKEIVERAMEETLSDITPEKEVVDLTEALIQEEWQKRKENKSAEAHEIEKELTRLQKEKDSVMERLINAEKETVIKAYESKIENISLNEMTLREKLGNSRNYIDFGTAFNKVMEYVKNPLKWWKKDDLFYRRSVIQMVFEGQAEYIPNVGFGTTNLAPIYKVFRGFMDPNTHDVETVGIEPTSKQGKQMTLQSLVRLLNSVITLKNEQNKQKPSS